MTPRSMPVALRASLVALVALAVCALAAPAAFAEANAVIPTSAAPGVSTTEINNYVEVPFPRNDDGTWPCGGGGNAPPACPGPEGQTGPETYPFGFGINFFGTKYSAAYINNNGNITFTEPLATYTPSSLTTFGSPIIAPYFADVDTRGEESAIVNFGQGTLNGKKVFVVNWPKVGCYNFVDTVLDNFQLILIDRADRATGVNGDDFDIEFNYNSIQWDTGEASGGNEFCVKTSESGTSAIAGYTNGSTNHFEIAGSEQPSAFLDSTESGLIHHDLNSSTLGRYLFTVANGEPPAPTELSTTLSGEAKSGANITVKEGSAVTDHGTLSGENAAKAGGTVTYTVYSDNECTKLVTEAGTVSVSEGDVPASSPETLPPGTYYWRAAYSGDERDNPSESVCGREVETVEETGKPPECKQAKGVGHAGPRNSEGLNENDNLNTGLTGKQEFEVTFPNKEAHFHLSHLTSASCKAISGGHVFSGEGSGKLNGKSGYTVTFSWEVVGKKVYFSVKIEKGGVVYYEVEHLLLNPGSKETIA